MELFVLKVAVIAACALALFRIAKSFAGDANHQASLGPNAELRPQSDLAAWPNSIPRIGSELPFPFDIRELEDALEAKYGPDFFRPRVLNYYFQNMNMETGPADPTDFFDAFAVEFENPENGWRWTASFWVTTPAGLVRQMNARREDSVWGTGTLIVRRFDLKTILWAVIEDCAASRAEHKSAESEEQQNPSVAETEN